MSDLITDAVFLSIQPRFATDILSGQKVVELRRTAPAVDPGSLVVLYVSAPVKAVLGAFRVKTMEVSEPEELWPRVATSAGLTRAEDDTYFEGAPQAVGIFIQDVFRAEDPVSLREMRAEYPGFHPPQRFRYLRSMGRKIQSKLADALGLPLQPILAPTLSEFG